MGRSREPVGTGQTSFGPLITPMVNEKLESGGKYSQKAEIVNIKGNVSIVGIVRKVRI